MAHRRMLAAALALAALVPFAVPAQARYIGPQIKEVPVERLAANLQAQIEKKPKDATLRLNLARLYAMSYALKKDTAEVNARTSEDAPWFGYEAKHVPFENQKTDDPEKLKAAQAQLDKAIAEYKSLVELAPKNLTARLGYAWCLEQAGKTMGAIEQYRKTIEMGWEVEKDKKSGGLGFHSVVAEAAEYLIPLLNQKEDKAEIAQIKERAAVTSKIPRPITPIAVPLADGLTAADLEDRAARLPFDADGSGTAQEWSWITPRAAWLVSDPAGSGQVTSALSMFGSVSWWLFWENGYQALAALDDNADGELAGDELAGLALWHDANGNAVSEPGEVQPLAAWGIVALSCRGEPLPGHADEIQHAPMGVRFADGGTRATFDLLLHAAASVAGH